MSETSARVLDVCCGARMMWFDKQNRDTVYLDKREFEGVCCDGRHITVSPDKIADFTNLPFSDETFYLVVFDPPHLSKLGDKSWLAQKYGKLLPDWEIEIAEGFKECLRVLKPNGTLIFKWNESEIPMKRVLALFGQKPLFGHRSGRLSKTMWFTFLKSNTTNDD